ncbi:MAG: NAD(P)H-dependent oxidoreductase [Hyphomicrobiaceae bacterium]
MPKAHIVLAHPEPQSYSGHLARTAQGALQAAGYEVTLTDLYTIGFDPSEGPLHFSQRKHRERFEAATEQRHAFERGTLAPQVRDELDRIENSDLLVLQFPLWWFGPPAILKGWIDRIFVWGGVYTSNMRFDTGKFRGKRAIVSAVGGGEAEGFELGGRNGHLMQYLWPVHYSLHYVGYSVLEPLAIYGVGGWSPEDVAADETARLGRHAETVAVAMQENASRPTLPFNTQQDWTAEGALKPGREDPGPFVYRPGTKSGKTA